MPRLRVGSGGRVAVVSLGLGLGTALASDLTVTPEPALVAPVTDAEFEAAGWRFFDPGFLVDHLPFKLTVGQSISYSDNVENLPENSAELIGRNGVQALPSRGDFYSDTTISLASRFPQGAQTYFFNGTYDPRRYFTDTALNADNFSVNGGVDFNVADRCSGRLIAGIDQSQQALFETAGFGVNDVTLTSFNETGRCKLTGYVTGLLNSGVSRSENSGGDEVGGPESSFALNNYDQQYVSMGLEYALTSLDTLRGQVTLTNRDFTDRSGVAGLASETQQDDFQVYYSRVFSSKLDVNASGGFSLFSFPGSGIGSLIEPVYSFQVNYRPTPKIAATFLESRSTGAPQNAVANVQTDDTQSVSLSYTYSPKLTVSASFTRTQSETPGSNAGALNGSNVLNGNDVLFANSDSDAASLVFNYKASPLLTATAAYTFQERTQTGRSAVSAESNIFRVGLFYTR